MKFQNSTRIKYFRFHWHTFGILRAFHKYQDKICMVEETEEHRISPVASKMFLIGNNLSFGNINTFFKDKATLLLGWSHRYKNSTDVITILLTVTKYSYLKWQWIFSFLRMFSFLIYHCKYFYLTWLYIWVTRRVS